MPNEITAEEFAVVKEFAEGLIECYQQKIKNTDEKTDSLVQESINMSLNYACNIIRLHLDLYDVKFKRYDYNFYKASEK